MLPLNITITPTTLVFNHLSDTGHINLVNELKLVYSEKGYFFLKGKPDELYKVLLKLSYDYDIEIIWHSHP